MLVRRQGLVPASARTRVCRTERADGGRRRVGDTNRRWAEEVFAVEAVTGKGNVVLRGRAKLTKETS